MQNLVLKWLEDTWINKYIKVWDFIWWSTVKVYYLEPKANQSLNSRMNICPLNGDLPFNDELPTNGELPLNDELPSNGDLPFNEELPINCPFTSICPFNGIPHSFAI